MPRNNMADIEMVGRQQGAASPSPRAMSPRKGADFRGVVHGMTIEEIKSKELLVTNVICDHPKKLMGACTVIFLVLCIIVFGVLGLSIDEDKMQSMDDVRTRKFSAVSRMQELLEEQSYKDEVPPADQPTHLYRAEPLGAITLMYEAEGSKGNILTLENMKKLKTIEERVYLTDDWKYYCLVSWYRPGDDCPGAGCPWYINKWDVTRDSQMIDGSRLVCDAPTGSLVWTLWNTRLVHTDTQKECDLTNNFEFCVTSDTVLPMYLTGINDTTPLATRRSQMETGGVEPTQLQFDALLRAVPRLVQNPVWARFKFFFDKTFADPAKANNDPTKYQAKVIRSLHLFGGPVGIDVDPKKTAEENQGKQCWSFGTQVQCEAVTGCKWSPYAGFYKNMTGCMVNQYSTVFPGSVDSEDNLNQQEEVADYFLKDLSDYLDDLDNDGFDVLYFMDGVLWDKFISILIRDSLLAMISFSFVYLYLQIHTGSFFLASLGMFQVIMPMPLGYFVYTVIFQIDVFNGLSTLSLFIVLAIGADDIFVFMDKWVQTDIRPRSDNCVYLKGRMAETWKDAGACMAITSVTTMSAFLATATSPIIQIKTFGIFAAILVFFDYVLVMTFFACAVVVYHRGWEGTVGCCMMGSKLCGAWCNCCTCYSNIKEGAAPGDKVELGWWETSLAHMRSFETIEEAKHVLGEDLDAASPQASPAAAAAQRMYPGAAELADYSSDSSYRQRLWAFRIMLGISVVVLALAFFLLSISRDDGNQFRALVLFGVIGLVLFTGAMNSLWAANARKLELTGGLEGGQTDGVLQTKIAPFLSGTHPNPTVNKCRFIPMAVLIVLWAVFISRAVELSHTTKADEYLPDWHPIQRGFTLYSSAFPTSSDDYVHKVYVAWGIREDDPEDRSMRGTWSSEIGEPRFYTGADKQTVLTDPNFQTFVSRFCNETLDRAATTGYIQRRFQVTNDNKKPGAGDMNCFMHGFEKWVTGPSMGRAFPVPANEFTQLLYSYLKQQYKRAKEDFEFLEPYEVHYDKVKFEFANGATNPPTGIEGMYVHFNTTLLFWGSPNGVLRSWYGSWNDWFDAIESKDASQAAWVSSLYNGAGQDLPFQAFWFHASEAWVRMRTQEFLVDGALLGTLVSLGLATVIIFIGTLNIIIALFVLLELIGVVGFVLGVVEIAGWELGLIESVAITILVGLAVDYVVHFAIHYDHCSVMSDDELAMSGSDVQANERQRRVAEVVNAMGPTVLGGAATSAGAALILVCTWIQFFNKFGITFLLTIVFSYIWAMFFFLPLMSVAGPQAGCGSLKPCVKRLLGKRSDKY